jgi:tRNA A58 N-methylase Trm61
MVVLNPGCGAGFFTTEIARSVDKPGKVIREVRREGMPDIARKKIEGTDIESRIELHKCKEDKIAVTEKVDLTLAFFMIDEERDSPETKDVKQAK